MSNLISFCNLKKAIIKGADKEYKLTYVSRSGEMKFTASNSKDLVITKNARFWYNNEVTHREDGPAIIYYCDGIKRRQWWVNGQLITRKEFRKRKTIFKKDFEKERGKCL